MPDATVTEIEEFKASKMPPLKLGTLKVRGSRIRVVLDCEMTAGAADLFADQLKVKAAELRAKGYR